MKKKYIKVSIEFFDVVNHMIVTSVESFNPIKEENELPLIPVI